jgi:hypothetical protein
MAKKGMLDAAQKTVVRTAKAGARGVKSVASDALGAAASAAAGVVLDRVSEALGSGQNKLESMTPAAQRAMQKTATPSKRTPAKKSVAEKKGSARKLGAAKRQSAGRKKSAGKASQKGKSPSVKRTTRKKSA